LQNSRTILTTFFELIEEDEVFKEEIAPIRSRLQRLDLRKRKARITLWNTLTKSLESPMIDAIDGLMVDLADKWSNTLGKALREQKLVK